MDHRRFKRRDADWTFFVLELLSQTYSKPREAKFDGKDIVLWPGQFIAGTWKLAEAMNWPGKAGRKKVENLVGSLKRDGVLRVETTPTGSLFTLLPPLFGGCQDATEAEKSGEVFGEVPPKKWGGLWGLLKKGIRGRILPPL